MKSDSIFKSLDAIATEGISRKKRTLFAKKGHDRPRRATPNHPGQTPEDGRLPWMYAGRNLGSPGTPCR